MKRIYLLIASFISVNLSHAQWSNDPSTGTLFANPITSENYQAAVTDGANGSIVVFESSNGTDISNLYAQRISSDGQLQWGAGNNPKPVCLHPGAKQLEKIIPDGSGGIYVLWFDYSADPAIGDIYMQHINSSGNPVWATNGIKINSNTGRETDEVRMCSDGGSGVIVVWSEYVYDENVSMTTYSQIFAQKFNSAGVNQWDADGVEVSTNESIRAGSSIVADGSGGVIIAFADTRNSTQSENDVFDNIDIYAQRINSAGSLLWTDDAKPIVTTPYNQFPDNDDKQQNTSISDGAGGLIVVFNDFTGNNDGNSNYYAQRINSSGVTQWAVGGIPVSVSPGNKSLRSLLSDGSGGITAFWDEDRTQTNSYLKYAQRILANGTPSWVANGIAFPDALSGYIAQGEGVAADGNGNYVFSWTDVNNDLKAQKINNSGVIQWGATAKVVCNKPGSSPVLPALVKSDAGNTIFTWLDSRNYNQSSFDIYAAKVDP